jgi:hypothetical protein
MRNLSELQGVKPQEKKPYIYCNRCENLASSDLYKIFYRHLSAGCLDNVGHLTSHNPIGLHDLLWG